MEDSKGCVIYEAIVSGRAIKVIASEQAFDPSKHKATELKNVGTEENQKWIGATIDGEPVVGTDQTLPPKGFPQLARLAVQFGNVTVEVPVALTRHVFNPHLNDTGTFTTTFADSIFSVSADGKCVLIDLAVGDDGGTSSVFFAISENGQTSTKPPSRPDS